MARRSIITRTVKGTEVTVLGINTETAEPENATYVIPGNYEKVVDEKAVFDTKKLLKVVKEAYDTETFANVKIVHCKTGDKIYGMWEEDFIANAFELDPKTRKPIRSDDFTAQ